MSSPPAVLSQVTPPIALKSTLKANVKKQNITAHILSLLAISGKSKFVETNPLIEKTRLSIEMTEFTCNLIENIVGTKNSSNIDKKALCVEILSDIYDLTPTEQATIQSQIQYIYNSGLIVKIPFVSRIKNGLVSVLKKYSPL